MVYAVGIAVRHVRRSRAIANQSRYLGFHSRESIQQLSQPLSCALRSCPKSFRVGKRRWPFRIALRAYGGGIVARLNRRLVGSSRWCKQILNGRALPIRRQQALSWQSLCDLLDQRLGVATQQ